VRDHGAASNLTENEASCCSQWTAFRGEGILTSKESFSINNSLEYNAIEGIVPGDPVTEPQRFRSRVCIFTMLLVVSSVPLALIQWTTTIGTYEPETSSGSIERVADVSRYSTSQTRLR